MSEKSAISQASVPQQAADPHCETGVCVCIHGHFYQPPRENPYLGAIEAQPGAAPFHDWNERIHHECYRPNAYARILNEHGEVIDIVNNFAYISFNIGPTLMSWLERHDPETYRRILEADRESCQRLDGHGNAIAQVYNHIIMPLANDRDKRTQICWGKADFVARFGRDPEGIWLAETAVDYPTLEALADEGFRFTILAPSQVQRCRPLPTAELPEPDWHEVGGGQIDPTRPYRCYLPSTHPDGSHRYIDVFFYDGPISRDMGFNDVLGSSQHFAGRIGQAVRGDHRPSQMIAVATDGETFGHHKGGAEKTLAYAVTKEFPAWGWQVTNFAHYLSCTPPTWEAVLKPVTAWSCSHGVDRWQDDCGCGGGGLWHQKWRRPLRDALDWLRDELKDLYEVNAARFFQDPWAARDAYVHVIRQRTEKSRQDFFAAHQTHELTDSEQVDALRLLEMQHHALLMYTSCGWFFDEISRPEGTQILRYAARAIELAGEVTGVELEPQFVERLEPGVSNVPQFDNAAGVYRQLAIPSQVSLEQVAAHYAMSSLFTPYQAEQRLYCYTIHQQDYQVQRMGPLSLAVGRLQITSDVTSDRSDLSFVVLHLGGWDFHCCVQGFRRRLDYQRAKDSVLAAFTSASSAQVILAMNEAFGDHAYNLQNLFTEERHRIMQLLSRDTLQRLDQLYSQVYRNNYGLIKAFHRDGLPVPQELQVAAEVAIRHRALEGLRLLEQETIDLNGGPLHRGVVHLMQLETIAHEAHQFHCDCCIPEGQRILEGVIWRSLRHFLDNPRPEHLLEDVDWLRRLIELGHNLGGISLVRSQELYWNQVIHWLNYLRQQESAQAMAMLKPLLKLAQHLAIDPEALLAHGEDLRQLVALAEP
jgi:alpha-amylase/alpha-mannosidase (GH57 family)